MCQYKTNELISGIYKIVNKINGKYYVGSSKDINGKDGRWNEHIQVLNRNKHINPHLQNAWNKYGQNNFDFIVVENVDEPQLLVTEQKYLDIAELEKHKCYNVKFNACGGEQTNKESISQKAKERFRNKTNHPMYGKHHSVETKLKIKMANSRPYTEIYDSDKLKSILLKKSIAFKGKNNPMYGMRHSEKTKLKISLSRTGQKLTDEHKKKIGLKSQDKTVFSLINEKNNERFIGTKHSFIVKYNKGQRNCHIYCMFKGIKTYRGWKLLY